MTVDPQKVVDLTFALALTLHQHPNWLAHQTPDEVAEWVAQKLRDNGIDTQPAGSSHGVLTAPKVDTAKLAEAAALESLAVALYESYARQKAASNLRKPAWLDLKPGQREVWRSKARGLLLAH